MNCESQGKLNVWLDPNTGDFPLTSVLSCRQLVSLCLLCSRTASCSKKCFPVAKKVKLTEFRNIGEKRLTRRRGLILSEWKLFSSILPISILYHSYVLWILMVFTFSLFLFFQLGWMVLKICCRNSFLSHSYHDGVSEPFPDSYKV